MDCHFSEDVARFPEYPMARINDSYQQKFYNKLQCEYMYF